MGLGGCGQIDDKKTETSPQNPKPPMFPEYFFDFCFKSNAGFPSLWEELKTSYGVDFKFEKTGLKFIVYNQPLWTESP